MKDNIFKCPECGEATIKASGFHGNPFCWGKCYHYFKWDEIIRIKDIRQKEKRFYDLLDKGELGVLTKEEEKEYFRLKPLINTDI